jgi:hypothetical protein
LDTTLQEVMEMLEDAIKELVGPEHAAAALDGSTGASGSSEVSCLPLAGLCSSLKCSILHFVAGAQWPPELLLATIRALAAASPVRFGVV